MEETHAAAAAAATAADILINLPTLLGSVVVGLCIYTVRLFLLICMNDLFLLLHIRLAEKQGRGMVNPRH